MIIELLSERAINQMSEAYSGDSKGWTKRTSVANVHDYHSWLSPRYEGVDQNRKSSVRIYLQVGRHGPADLPEHSFPAVFNFIDGVTRYPDKGIINALDCNGLVEEDRLEGELVFLLTEEGQRRFGSRP